MAKSENQRKINPVENEKFSSDSFIFIVHVEIHQKQTFLPENASTVERL